MKILVVLAILILMYALFIEPNILTVKKITVQDSDLAGLKVVFATDFHFKPYEKFRLERIVRRINAQQADIILLGGDYVNGHEKSNTLLPEEIAAGFANLKSKYGTIAVMGNHDGWQGKKEVIEAFEAAGISVLENSAKDFGDFAIAGVEDLQTSRPDVSAALNGIEKPVILLTHTPDIIDTVPSHVNLTLAGHTHGGQVVLHKPLVVPSKFGTKYAYGMFKSEKMFVSRGLGTSIFPVRFNCFPQIVVIEFK